MIPIKWLVIILCVFCCHLLLLLFALYWFLFKTDTIYYTYYITCMKNNHGPTKKPNKNRNRQHMTMAIGIQFMFVYRKWMMQTPNSKDFWHFWLTNFKSFGQTKSFENWEAKRSQRHANARPLEICPPFQRLIWDVAFHGLGVEIFDFIELYQLDFHWIHYEMALNMFSMDRTLNQTTITKSHSYTTVTWA